jgi:hypothetical protein
MVIGNSKSKLAKLFPDHLEQIAANLHHSLKPMASELLAANTMYPYSAPFLAPEQARKVKTEMLGQYPRGTTSTRVCNSAIGMRTNSPLRICPECVKADIVNYGVPFWHCIHQVSPLKICGLHKCPLRTTPVLRSDRELISVADVLPISGELNSSNPSRLQLALADNILGLSANTWWEIGAHRLVEGCRIEFQRRGRNLGSRSAGPQLISELLSTFGEQELRDCGAEIRVDGPNWVRPIFHELMTKSQREDATSLRLQHFNAICCLLGVSLQELFRTSVSVPEIETPPWPCLSIGLPCSGKLVINFRRTHTSNRKTGVTSGRFQCLQCGTTYFRPLPLRRNADGSFEHRFPTVPKPVCVNTLKEIWQSPSQSWSTLAARLGASRHRIASEAARLELPDMPRRTLVMYRKVKSSRPIHEMNAAQKRATLLEFQAANPTVRLADTPKFIRTLYAWLRMNDPVPLPSFASGKRIGLKGKRGFSNRDQEFAEMLRPKIGEARIELTRPFAPRVSIPAVLRYFGPRITIPITALKNMPRTSELILSIVETSQDRRTRWVRQVVESLERAQTLPTWTSISCKFGCFNLTPEERQRIRSAYLKNGRINRCGRFRAAA